MRIWSIRRGLVLCCGWLLIFVTAAAILPPFDPLRVSGKTFPILTVAAAWLVLTVIALAHYFFRAWKRVHLASNKKTYIAWLTFEAACVLASMCGLVWLLVPIYVTIPRQARERALRQDLETMRAIIAQYTLDMRKAPLSLDDLVVSGYIKEVPTDPMTLRKDTWVVVCSSDRSQPGIVDIESGYGNLSNKANLRCSW